MFLDSQTPAMLSGLALPCFLLLFGAWVVDLAALTAPILLLLVGAWVLHLATLCAPVSFLLLVVDRATCGAPSASTSLVPLLFVFRTFTSSLV